MKNILLPVLMFSIAMIVNTEITSAQSPVVIRSNGFTAEKQAKGQTSWLTRKLNLNKELEETVYKINLKYLLQTDSLRMVRTETINKRDLHLTITQNKNAELQSVLSSEQYAKYLSAFDKPSVLKPK